MVFLLNSVILSSILLVSGLFLFYISDSVGEIFALIPSSDTSKQGTFTPNPATKSPQQTTPSTPATSPRLIDPNKALQNFATNPDLKVLPPHSNPLTTYYTCMKDPATGNGACVSVGVKDSLMLEKDKANVCKGDLKCNDKGCICIMK